MKTVRQIYCVVFLTYCVSAALLILPSKVIILRRVPYAFALIAISVTISVIFQMIRCWREISARWKLIPAIIIVIVCLLQIIGFFGLINVADNWEKVVWYYYFNTSMLNIVVAAIGFGMGKIHNGR